MMSISYAPTIRQIQPPLTDDQLFPLDKACEVIQFCDPLTEKELIRLSEFHASYPDIPLRVYGIGPVTDLEFLCHFPFLREFQADVWSLKSFDGLRHLPTGLRYLGLGGTFSKAPSLRVIERFSDLRELYIEKHTKELSVLNNCTKLESLSLRSITLKDLSDFTGLRNLHTLRIRLGGITNLQLLPHVGALKHLELWRILGLSDLGPIGELKSLQFLFLQALKRVTALPTLRALEKLRRVHLQALNGIRDLTPISDAPNLRELVVSEMPQLEPQDFVTFVNHPKLNAALIGLGSKKKNEAVKELLKLPTTEYRMRIEFEDGNQ